MEALEQKQSLERLLEEEEAEFRNWQERLKKSKLRWKLKKATVDL